MRSFFSVPSVFRSLIAVLLGGLLMHSGSGGATVPTDRAVEPLTATIVACGDIVPHYEVVTPGRTTLSALWRAPSDRGSTCATTPSSIPRRNCSGI